MWTFQYHFNAIALMQKKNHTQIYFYMRKDHKKTATEINVRLIPLNNDRRLRETEEKRKREEKMREEMHNIRIERIGTITCVYAAIRRFSWECKPNFKEILSRRCCAREKWNYWVVFSPRCVKWNDQRLVFV